MEIDSTRPYKKAKILCITLLSCIYLVSYLIIPKNGFWSNDNGVKFIQAESIIINKFLSYDIHLPGKEVDPELRYSPIQPQFAYKINGALYGSFSYAFALISAAAYYLLGFHGLHLISLISAFFLFPVIWNLSSLLTNNDKIASIFSVVFAAICTPIWFYSLTFWEHLPAVALCVSGLYFAFRYRSQGKLKYIVASAILYGLSIYFRDELYLFVFSIVFVVFSSPRELRKKGLFLFAGVLLASQIPLWLFNISVFGNLLDVHANTVHLFEGGLTSYLSSRLTVINRLLFNIHPIMQLSVLIGLPFVILLATNPRLSKKGYSFAMVMGSVWGLVCGIVNLTGLMHTGNFMQSLFNSNGFFAVSPLLTIGLFGSKKEDGNSNSDSARILWISLMYYIVLYLLLCPAMNVIGMNWGCRLLLPIYALLSILAGRNLSIFLQIKDTHIAKYAAVVLVILISFLSQIYSLHLLYARKSFNSRLNTYILQRKEKHIIAAGWFVPQELGISFTKKAIYLAKNEYDIASLKRLLKEKGVDEILIVSAYQIRNIPASEKITMRDSLNLISLDIIPVNIGGY
jgi:hypothetical protein